MPVPGVSSQSPPVTEKPTSVSHAVRGMLESPKPSRSASMKPLTRTISSMVPSQSSSSALQTSAPSGFEVKRASSQSGPQSLPLQQALLSKPSPSSSMPPRVVGSQSSSRPAASQSSTLPAKTSASSSSQSVPSAHPRAP